MAVRFDPDTGIHHDSSVKRGFPLGGIGAGGFGFDTDGGFGELRLNNNPMCPIPPARGCFHALFVRRGAATETLLLRRARKEGEFEGARTVRSTEFVGTMP